MQKYSATIFFEKHILLVVGGIGEAQRGAEIPIEGCEKRVGICTISTRDHRYSGYIANINLIT